MTLSLQLLDRDDHGRQDHDPTPEEIRLACWRIQKGWDRATRRARVVGRGNPVELTTMVAAPGEQ